MDRFGEGLAERILREGRLVAHQVHSREAITQKQLAEFRSRTVDKISDCFGDRVSVTHHDDTVNGTRLFIEPQEQAGQVRAEIIDLPFVHSVSKSLFTTNCLLVRFRTHPSLGCGEYLQSCVLLAVLAAVLLYILGTLNPAFGFGEKWLSFSL